MDTTLIPSSISWRYGRVAWRVVACLTLLFFVGGGRSISGDQAIGKGEIASIGAEPSPYLQMLTDSVLGYIAPLTDLAGFTSDVPDCDLWLVNTRNNCGCQFKPQVRHYQCGRGWRSSTLDAFYDSDREDVITVVFIHGNNNSPREALNQGMRVYHRFCRPGCGGPRMRFVIWSWPSTFIPGSYRHDLRVKAGRVDPQAFQLAHFLAQMGQKVPTTLMGYSYGAAIAMGALHLQAGGELCGRTLEAPRPQDHCNVVLMAAAMSNTALAPGCHYDRAMDVIQHLTVMVNCRDRILRYYPRLHGFGGPPAMGYTGAVCLNQLGEARDRIVHVDVHPYLRRHHCFKAYLASCEIMSCARSKAIESQLPESASEATAAPVAQSVSPPVVTASAKTTPAETPAITESARKPSLSLNYPRQPRRGRRR